MPPRYAYWTIMAGGLPTAFRAVEREELLPTFNRLKQKHPDAEMKYFARGRLWSSPEDAQREAETRRGADRRFETPRGRDWRPGGEHRDPRQPFKDAKKDRNQEWRKERFEKRERFGKDRARPDSGERPRGPREETALTERRPWNNRSRDDRKPFSGPPQQGAPGDRKPFGSPPRDQGPRGRKPFSGRPKEAGPGDRKPFGHPPREGSSRDRKPFGGRPWEGAPRDRKQLGDRTRDERGGDRKSFDRRPEGRPQNPQQSGDRHSRPKPWGSSRPPAKGASFAGSRSDRKPFSAHTGDRKPSGGPRDRPPFGGPPRGGKRFVGPPREGPRKPFAGSSGDQDFRDRKRTEESGGDRPAGDRKPSTRPSRPFRPAGGPPRDRRRS
jgi:hypothetical protein